MPIYDVIVIGLGAMGSAACLALARRGAKVLGLEQFDIPHPFGSSHGQSRMIRLCYYEHPDYVPLLRRSYELWRELERDYGQPILHVTGGLYAGPPGSAVLKGSLRSAREHGLAHEVLSPSEAVERFPQFVLPADYDVMLDHSAGLVLPERAVAAQCELALRAGADLRGREAVLAWESTPDGRAIVRTARGQYAARHLIFCGGAWTGRLVADLGAPLTVTRQAMVWVWPTEPRPFALGQMPVWFTEHRNGQAYYGFPMLPDCPGLKLASHNLGPAIEPGSAAREPNDSDEALVRPCLRDFLPRADGPVLSIRTCLYTNTPDAQFILDRHPRHPHVLLAGGFSGHGFKFAPVIGQLLSEMALDGTTTLPVGFLGLNRFSKK